MLASCKESLHAAFLAGFYLTLGLYAYAQSNSTSLNGTVLDPSGAVVANATVEIHNPVSHFDRSTITDSAGRFSFPNVAFNPYHLSVTGAGFTPYAQDVDVRSAVPLDIKITVINLANNYALYNFLSTFSGTHYVTPRVLTAQIGFHF